MKRKHIILFHLLLWIYLLYPSFALFIFPKDGKIDPTYIMAMPMDISISILNFYVFYFFISPLFFKTRFKIYMIFIGIGFIPAFTIVRYIIYYFCNIYLFGTTEIELYKELSSSYTIALELRYTLVFGLYAFFARFLIEWFKTQKQKSDLINQTQASELSLLRSQINPHFLFNTLNNIYSLVYKKSDDAPEAVMKLSSIMRYTLYDSNTDKVLLEKEIEYLKSFIELQQLRLKKENFVEFSINGDIKGIMITPMVFISFVENAFKHGSKKVTSPGIVITLTINESKTVFEVMNYMVKDDAINKDVAGGIGLQNIKRRLELIYKDNYKLEIKNQDDQFIVKLEIDNQ